MECVCECAYMYACNGEHAYDEWCSRRVSGWGDVCMHSGTTEQKIFHSKQQCGFQHVCKCVFVLWLYMFVLSWKSRQQQPYCGALGRSRVNSSLTPIHYGPLLPPSWCSRLRHSQPPPFMPNVNHSGWVWRHGGGESQRFSVHYAFSIVYREVWKTQCVQTFMLYWIFTVTESKIQKYTIIYILSTVSVQ